jgi:CheY-like chemotaxis protein
LAKILIVDDSAEFCRLTQRILERGEHSVLTAHSGLDGIVTADLDQPDLILLDYMMPGLNGRETFEQLRENVATAHIPVIMVTAFSTTPDMDRMIALRLGMDDFLTKPVSSSVLLERIADVLVVRRQAGSAHD